ncbi:hypothetical protein SAMN06295912_1044 [Sphingomonas laterariae]|uniref:Uncharacterized protein n=1 Tax=Edaphosphingomonas laterariae TaxID=861865 RepID=A0A239DBX4_9SPHN|nr:hypothetical protein [Sphingomonas laterariae]SNS29193.1 hypothetical protein SAMN06295912_1044 [Sphingomonas laterariae]
MARKSANPSNPFKVRNMRAKQLRSGAWAYYWQPSDTLRAKGWEAQALGNDIGVAIDKARELNEDVARWKAGAAKPKAVQTFVPRQAARIADALEALRKMAERK